MAWTQSDIDALKAAIATGARDVSYSDRRVSYRSLDEMRTILRMVTDEVNETTRTRQIRPQMSKGFCG